MRSSLRSIIVLAAVVATVGVAPLPAAAAVLPATDVRAGTLTMTRTSVTPMVIPLASTAGCPADRIELDVVGTAANITSYTATAAFTYGPSTYIALITRLTHTQGTITGASSATLSGLGLQVQVSIYADNGGCNRGTARLCALKTTLTLAGAYSGDPANPSSIDQITLAAPGAPVSLVVGTCQVPFSVFNGSTATVTGLVAGSVPLDITSGSQGYATYAGSTPGTSSMPLASASPCPPDGLWMDFTASTARLVGLTSTSAFALSTSEYTVITTVTSSTAGTRSGSGTVTLTGLQATFANSYYPSSGCVPTTATPLCTVLTTFTMTGTYTGNPTTPTVGDVVVLGDGTSRTVANPTACTLPGGVTLLTSTLNGLTATVL